MIPHRTIESHWDFIFENILRERPNLYNLLEKRSISEWYLARSWLRNGLVELPASASLVRNTKELLEGDYFDRQGNREKEIHVILVAQRVERRPRTKYEDPDDTSSPQVKVKQEKQAKTKKETKKEIKEEIKQEPQSVRPQQYGRPPQSVRRRHDTYQLPPEPSSPVRPPLTHKRSRHEVSSSPDDEIPTEPLTPVRTTDRTIPVSTPSYSELSEPPELPSPNLSFFRAINHGQALSGASTSDGQAISRVPLTNELFVRDSLPASPSPPQGNIRDRTRSAQGALNQAKGSQQAEGGQSRKGGRRKGEKKNA